MRLSKDLVQEIAVFGESGSGKTVLVSAFYGSTQEEAFESTSSFRLVAEDTGQGHRLHEAYLGMKNSNRAPDQTKYATSSYSFRLIPKGAPKKSTKGSYDGIRVVWHDYPGEWFESDELSGPEEAQRRIDTFRSLLGSDVALLLVDGQRLVDNAGHEERYLKSVLSSYKNGLLRLKDRILVDGEPIARFPRIWILTLSKADLIPEMNARRFGGLLVEKARHEIDALSSVIADFVVHPEALSVGSDFLRVSSARFQPGLIDVESSLGLDIMLPIAAVFPLERQATWVRAGLIPKKMAAEILGNDGLAGVAAWASALVGSKLKLPGPFGVIAGLLIGTLLGQVSKAVGEKLEKMHQEALARHDYLTATLTGMKKRLDAAEGEGVLRNGSQ